MIILVITSMGIGINTVMPMTIIILRATPTITARGRRVRMRPA
jgi:hypothetical protein